MDEQWTILNTIKWLTEYFEKKGIPEARLNAEHIIAHSLEIKRLDLYLKFDCILKKDELSKLKPLIERRAKREPLQYIIETQPFRNIEVKVNKDVLIPRPETEIVVEEALKRIDTETEIDVLEIGVGNGAILKSMAEERQNLRMTGVEISSEALDVAKENLKDYEDRITLFQGDLFSPISGTKFDLIISNPPYIPFNRWKELEPEVRDYEPKGALVAGEDGLDFYRRIFNDVHSYIKPDGWLILELGDGQAKQINTLAVKNGRLVNLQIIKDLNNKDRVFLSQRSASDF